MKKYLMTGIAALAMCFGFTSCSHDIDTLSQEEIDQMKANEIIENYKKAFVAQFGQPAADQDWGFGTTTRGITRSWNVNGNQWHDGVNYNYEYDAPVTTAEKNLVFNYVNNVNNVEKVDQISFTQYWVAQIWNGKTDQNADGVKAPVSHSYPNQNGAITDIIGGAQMDKLEILEKAGTWTHCNNFNAADNNDWKEGGEEGRTLMENSGTLSFRYTNSQSSYLSEKYIIVPGEKIDASLKGFYYVCFDFERGYTDAEWAQEKTMGTYEAWNGNNYQGGWNFTLDGNLNEDQVKAAIGQQNGRDIQNINIKGYLYGDKHCDGDGNYTDWIVRISPAKVKSSDEYSVRVIAEDLTFGQDLDTDFDFNDVVFDVCLKTTETKIRLKAAGGTLPLIIGVDNPQNDQDYIANEVHNLFGVGVNVMVNTHADKKGLSSASKEDAFLTLTKHYSNAKDIPVYVKKNGAWVELTAVQGEPASKIGVDINFKWVDERDSMKGEYPLFVDWVKADATFRSKIKWW